MNLYRSKKWKQFRAEALRLGEQRCARCSHSLDNGAILHVHHKRYITGMKPWEYSHEDCELLCQSCHAQEHGIIPPKTGWVIIGYDDLGAPDSHCDYCGTQIRHVYLIQHEKWAVLEVGAICCDKLTVTCEATAHMKKRREFLERQKKFVSKWNLDADGLYIQCKGFFVRVIQADNTIKLQMNKKLGKQVFISILEAKIRAFEVIDSGQAATYFRRRVS